MKRIAYWLLCKLPEGRTGGMYNQWLWRRMRRLDACPLYGSSPWRVRLRCRNGHWFLFLMLDSFGKERC